MKNDNERAEEVMGSYTWLLIILSVILSVLMLIFGKFALMDQSFGHAFCLVQGAQPLLSYNLGAKNISRVKKTFRVLLVCCVSGSLLIWLICMTLPNTVASVFTSDAALITYTNKSMRVYLAMLFIYGIQVACQYSFVALDQAPKAIFLTIWRKIIILIPLIFILPHFVPNAVMGVYLAEPIADTIAVCTTAPMFYSYYRKLKC